MEQNKKLAIRMKADALRKRCTVNNYGLTNLFKDCKNLGYKLIRYPLGEYSELGFVTKKDEDTIIFTNSSVRLSRELFTLAHELGHCVLHLNTLSSFMDNDETISSCNEDEKELEANYFAAHFLMPRDEIAKFLEYEIRETKDYKLTALDIARIMDEFKVSFSMVLNHLENLEFITHDEYICLDNQKTSCRVGRLLSNIGGNTNLNSVSNSIDIPYEYLNYVIYNYNHKAIPRETLDRVLMYYKLTFDDVHDRISIPESSDGDSLEDIIGGLPD